MAWVPVRMDAASIAHVAPTVQGGIGVEEFPIEPFMRRADSIVIPRNRSEVAHAEDLLIWVLSFPQECDDGVRRVMKIHPLESLPIMVDGMESALGTVEPVEVPYQVLHSSMELVLKQVPVETVVMGPFVPLGEFAAHEEHLLPRMTVHDTVQCA